MRASPKLGGVAIILSSVSENTSFGFGITLFAERPNFEKLIHRRCYPVSCAVGFFHQGGDAYTKLIASNYCCGQKLLGIPLLLNPLVLNINFYIDCQQIDK